VLLGVVRAAHGQGLFVMRTLPATGVALAVFDRAHADADQHDAEAGAISTRPVRRTGQVGARVKMMPPMVARMSMPTTPRRGPKRSNKKPPTAAGLSTDYLDS
jgi:hypothetical protein